ncbi:hypothetical protein QP178_03620 [Sphingomonas aurantiaca]|uniref:hypothetical protein n=1 Tax=Sphingomonas aurantiaca TaxID=185949 RepID=UPI002FE21BBB
MTPDHQPGPAGAFTALILAAPGRVELAESRPAAGQTGRNLDRILVHLHRWRPDVFPSQSRLDYVIVNSVSTVLYRAKNGRGMPTDAEVRDMANVGRLRLLLPSDLRHLVAFSDPAATAVGLVGREPVFRAPHPGLQLINRRYFATGATGKLRAEERCRLFARDMLGMPTS